jgi:probable F420-dependent oxidoreductase
VRFSLSLPTDRVDRQDEFVTGAAVAELAAAAEAAGYDAVFVTEHPAPERSWLDTGGHQALDPFVALGFAAAATTTLRVQTNLTVVPYRNPFLLAKAAATLDVLSGGRLVLGVGAGYLEAEFRAVGADFERRNDVMDAALRTVTAIWSGEPVEVAAPDGGAPSTHVVRPLPVQRPRPPMWVGGNSKRAIRRAVELCDGWMPMPNPKALVARRRSAALETVDDLAAGLRYASDHAAAVGRTAPLDVMSMAFTTAPYGSAGWDRDAALEELAALAAVGVTQFAVGFHTETRAEDLDQLHGYAAEVVAAAP